jgi:hypothetical protein
MAGYVIFDLGPFDREAMKPYRQNTMAQNRSGDLGSTTVHPGVAADCCYPLEPRRRQGKSVNAGQDLGTASAIGSLIISVY